MMINQKHNIMRTFDNYTDGELASMTYFAKEVCNTATEAYEEAVRILRTREGITCLAELEAAEERYAEAYEAARAAEDTYFPLAAALQQRSDDHRQMLADR